MGWFLRCLLIISVVFPSFFTHSAVTADTITFNSSTQLLWGDDLLGEGQSIIAQYMRFSLNPEGKTYSFTGYGRIWRDISGGEGIRDEDLLGRLYYLYMDYDLSERVSFRLGRQFVRFTASGSTIIDGLNVDVKDIGPVSLTLAGGKDVVFTLNWRIQGSATTLRL